MKPGLNQLAKALVELVREETQFTSPTLVDIAVGNAADSVIGLIDETIITHPELDLVAARSISGINYKTLVRTVLPGVGFRNANEGYAATKGTYENRLVETYIFNPNWSCDKAIADRYEDGPEAFIALEASAIMEAALQSLCSQFYYGLTTLAAEPRHASLGDTKGFPGLHDSIGLTIGTDILVDAAGTNASACSSVFMLKSGPKDVIWVWGNEGALEMGDVREESQLDSGGTNSFTAYKQEVLAYPGLQVGNVDCVGRVAEIGSAASGGTSLTDTMLASLYAQFPTAKKPDMILMARRSQAQLRANRTATNATGAPAPFPTEWEGIPIHITDSISITEEAGLI